MQRAFSAHAMCTFAVSGSILVRLDEVLDEPRDAPRLVRDVLGALQLLREGRDLGRLHVRVLVDALDEGGELVL